MNTNHKFVYFGGEPIGVPVLEELMICNLKPSLIVCSPDRPAGRGLELTPPSIKKFAIEHDIEVYQPQNLKDETSLREKLADFDLFVVVAYNRIMPEWLIELPKYKTINVHPSLLPLRRGPNPIRSAIVEDDRASIGVSIMLMDKDMDHGPILEQQAMDISDENWPVPGPDLDFALARMGGAMLADTIPRWIANDIAPQEQEHDAATYTSKVTKADGEIDLTDDPWSNYLKITAYQGWPGTFFWHQKDGTELRIKINQAQFTEGKLCLETVTPEGKRPMSYEDFTRSY